jgi:glutamyl-tRNA synthetase
VSLFQYADDGYLPEAMLNFLARLGWSHGDAEVFSRDELIEWFELDGISASPARFNGEKLKWLNAEHIKLAPSERLGELLAPFLIAIGVDPRSGPSPAAAADLYRERATSLTGMAAAVRYLYEAPQIPDALRSEHLTSSARELLAALRSRIASLEWSREALLPALKTFAGEKNVKLPQIMMPLRVALSGGTSTPSLDAVMAVLGRERTLERIDAVA